MPLQAPHVTLPVPALLGVTVGAQRWPQPLHSGAQPWKGVVLAFNDKRAWEKSVAFGSPADSLSQADIDLHVKWCLDQGLLRNSVPVLWDFNPTPRVYWTNPVNLVEYEEDLRRWKLARQQALDELATLREPKSPFALGEEAGLAGKPGPAFPTPDSPWSDRLYARGWSSGVDRRNQDTRRTASCNALDFEQSPALLSELARLPAYCFPRDAVKPMAPPVAGSTHQAFFKHLQSGGSLWRDDPVNNVREWIDMARLGGDAGRIQLYDFKTLSYTVSPAEAAMRMHLASRIEKPRQLADEKGLSLSASELRASSITAEDHFDFGVRLHQLKAGIEQMGPQGLAARIACARHIFASGQHRQVCNNDYHLIFDFGGRDYDRLFEMWDGSRVKAALMEDAARDPAGEIARTVQAHAWVPAEVDVDDTDHEQESAPRRERQSVAG